MKCPVDDTVLQMTEREGVEIDYCPTCRGIWLDRGELDTILERAATHRPGPPTERDPYRERDDEHDRDHRGEHGRFGSAGHGKKKERLGFLSDLLGGD